MRARSELDRLVQIFGRDQVYIEIQDAGIEAHRRVNPGLLQLADETGLPTVGTGDVHYLRAEDADPHEALLCIQTGDELANPKRFRFENKEFFFKTPDEMARDLAPYGRELLRPTLEIAERCNVQIELGTIRLPHVRRPGRRGRVRLPHAAAARPASRERYGTVTPDLKQRLEFELQTIREMGFADYFLIVWDFVHFAKPNGDRRRPGPRLGRRLAGRLRARASPTSTRSATTCCSSASSTRAASRCPTSTSTSRSPAASAS